MKIQRFTVNPLQENCYVASDDTGECIIIDCGAYDEAEYAEIAKYIHENNLKPVYHLLTHAHFDHCFGAGFVYKEFGLKPEMHINDQALYEKMGEQTQQIMNMPLEMEMPPAGKYLNEKDVITFGNTKMVVLETPGHSPGCVFYYCEKEKIAFSGDTLFKGSIGRTDFMGGSMFKIIMSLRTICQMDDDIKLYPGHGEETTIGYECATNMYLDR